MLSDDIKNISLRQFQNQRALIVKQIQKLEKELEATKSKLKLAMELEAFTNSLYIDEREENNQLQKDKQELAEALLKECKRGREKMRELFL